MGRLIDVDELKKAIDVACSTGYITPTEHIIDAVPTAYDVDEVIERLKMCSVNEPLTENGVVIGSVKVLPLSTVIEIVKDGVK